MAEQGKPDRIHTIDCSEMDRNERGMADDDSMKSSDWYDRTSIDPEHYKNRKAVEAEFASLRDQNKRFKRGF